MQAGAKMVKLEGGAWLAPTVAFLVERGIPVCAHLGLTPQSVHALGGYRVQGRSDEEAERLLADARALDAAGAAMLVLELVPSALAERVTQAVGMPTIGIGAGQRHVRPGARAARHARRLPRAQAALRAQLHAGTAEHRRGDRRVCGGRRRTAAFPPPF